MNREEKLATMASLYRSGVSARVIAECFGVQPPAVNSALRSIGVPVIVQPRKITRPDDRGPIAGRNDDSSTIEGTRSLLRALWLHHAPIMQYLKASGRQVVRP